MRDRDDLDQLIDSALASYAEPRSGLERRTLARISEEKSRSSRRRWLLAFALPLTASLLFLGYLIPRTTPPKRDQVAMAPGSSLAARVESSPAKHAAPQSVTRKHNRVAERLPVRARMNIAQRPKLDIFPTPQPLSDAEQAVTRFASDATEAQRKALVAQQQNLAEPIQITAIHIPPLPSPEEDKN
jgi:hypothetical protein